MKRNYTLFKDGKHYCPKCKKLSSNVLMRMNVDIRLRDFGAKFKHPEWGDALMCKECNWSGTWAIEDTTLLAQLEKASDKVNNEMRNNLTKQQWGLKG